LLLMPKRAMNMSTFLSDFQKENCYAVKIKDRSMLPLFRPGTLLTAEHDSWEMIKSDDMMIYRGSENLQARKITITPESIILRGFNPSVEEFGITALAGPCLCGNSPANWKSSAPADFPPVSLPKTSCGGNRPVTGASLKPYPSAGSWSAPGRESTGCLRSALKRATVARFFRV
jgi:hypothetical protein